MEKMLKLMMTDTDSLLYHVVAEDLYSDMQKDNNYLTSLIMHRTIFSLMTSMLKNQDYSKMRQLVYLLKSLLACEVKCTL